MVASDPKSIEVRLRVGAAQIRLGLGDTFIGRSPSCDVVLHSSKVSRKHACIHITASSVRVEDLGSANGVFVNGHPISGAKALSHGDRVAIGGEELEVVFGDASGSRANRPGAVTRGDRPTRTVAAVQQRSPEAEAYDSEAPSGTRRADAFELIGQIVDRALAEGRAADAESMMRVHLAKVLDEAKARGTLSPETRASALDYALKIASATQQGRWVDYVFEMLTALRLPLSATLTTSLRAVVANVDGIRSAKVQSYVDVIRSLADERQTTSTMHSADAILRAVGSRRGSTPPVR